MGLSGDHMRTWRGDHTGSRRVGFAMDFSALHYPVESSSFVQFPQWFSTKICTSSYNDFTVSYLVNSCGLSPKAAVKASDKVNLQPSSLARPDSVLAVLREHEFSDTQISTLVRRDPRFLLADAKRTLLPKLEFLFSKGMSRLDVAKIVTYNSFLLSRSVENCFVPCYTFLKSVVVCDAKVKSDFVQAMEALSRKETTWKRCQEAYRSWGWSDDDILSAFKAVYDQV
ncbi:hypothetical protein ACLB2K_010493 [Fragaria x ananassa]